MMPNKLTWLELSKQKTKDERSVELALGHFVDFHYLVSGFVVCMYVARQPVDFTPY